VQSLSESQVHTLRAVVDRIIPKDDYPSASEAGCVEFLLHLMEQESLVDTYRFGLDGVDAHSHGTAFADLSAHQQDEVLESLAKKPKSRKFITLIARQTIEGYYSDPGNGANRGARAWEMIGFKVTA